MLEHGCEVTHNDAVRNDLTARGLDPSHFDWASVQLDGGLKNVTDKVIRKFKMGLESPVKPMTGSIKDLKLGLMSCGTPRDGTTDVLTTLIRNLVQSGAQVVVPENVSIANTVNFLPQLGLKKSEWTPNLGYSIHPKGSGLFVMATPSNSITETLTGLGGTGVELILMYTDDIPISSHPLIPVLQFSDNAMLSDRFGDDYDFILSGANSDVLRNLLTTNIEATLNRDYTPIFK